MAFRPEVFVSAASPELDPYRETVKRVLREIGAHPVEHIDYRVEYGPLNGVLNVAIRQCEAVIHLVGFAFGKEPAERTLGAPRRSFPHYEIDVARSLKVPVYYFVAAQGTPTLPQEKDDPEAADIQREHRHSIEQSQHWTFTSEEDLAQQLRALRPRLVVRRQFLQLPIPPRHAELVGRTRVLNELREALSTPGIVVLHNSPLDLTGGGGIGKTALAAEIASRLHEDRTFDFVFWLPGDSRAELDAALAALAGTDALALLPAEVADHGTRLDAVRKWFRNPEHAGRYLVVIDGVDHEAAWWMVSSAVDLFATGTILITTPLNPVETTVRALPVGAMSIEHASELLTSLIFTQRKPDRLADAAITRIAASLQRHPLALRIAAAAIHKSGRKLEDFHAQITASTSANRTESQATHVARWSSVLARVIDEALALLDDSARSTLRLLACLAPQPALIPLELFENRGDWPQTRAALTTLEELELLSFDSAKKGVFLHRTVREVIRDRISAADLDNALGTARGIIEAALSAAARGSTNTELRARIVPHCRALLGQLNGHPLEADAGRLVRLLGDSLRECGRLADAEPFYRRAVLIAEKKFGIADPEVAPELRPLATCLRNMGRFSEAEAVHRRTLAILEQYFGTRDTRLVPELTAIAGCLRAQDRFEEAEACLRRTVDIESHAHGPDHPKAGLAHFALAGVLEIMGRTNEAIRHYRRSLEIDERAFGPDHPRVAIRLQNLARARAEIGARLDAERLFERSFIIDQKAIQENNPELLAALNDFGILQADMENVAEAERTLRHALRLAQTAFGPGHIETAITHVNLASVLQERGNTDDARKHLAQARDILDKLDAERATRHPLIPALRRSCEKIDERLAASSSPASA